MYFKNWFWLNGAYFVSVSLAILTRHHVNEMAVLNPLKGEVFVIQDCKQL